MDLIFTSALTFTTAHPSSGSSLGPYCLQWWATECYFALYSCEYSYWDIPHALWPIIGTEGVGQRSLPAYAQLMARGRGVCSILASWSCKSGPLFPKLSCYHLQSLLLLLIEKGIFCHCVWIYGKQSVILWAAGWNQAPSSSFLQSISDRLLVASALPKRRMRMVPCLVQRTWFMSKGYYWNSYWCSAHLPWPSWLWSTQAGFSKNALAC